MSDSVRLMHKPASVQGRKYRRPSKYGDVDGRSTSGRYIRRVREELLRHVDKPTGVQLALIERAAWLTLHVTRMDAAIAAGGQASDHAARQYLAWSNALARTLAKIGLKATAQQGPSLDAYLARHGEAA